MTQTEFLLNTLEYYTADTNRRCMNSQGTCRYSPKNVGKEGISEGCAIGRFMTPENQMIGDNHCSTRITTIYRDIKEILPDWMVAFGVDFLSEVQNFHDNPDCWEHEKGLTNEGKSSLESIIDKENLDISLFSQYLS